MADLSFAHDSGMQDGRGDNEYMDFTVCPKGKSIPASGCLNSLETMPLSIYSVSSKS
jgi:hypothetical protein